MSSRNSSPFEDTDDSDSDDSRTRPQKRKRKTAQAKGAPSRPVKRVRGRRGALALLVEMPLDLLFEIFGKLDPIDVLHLARSTKSLRAILMGRSAANIWREALRNVERLPPCPPDLNEPQWVDLVFGKNCYFCGKMTRSNSQAYAWEARVRGCISCIVDEFHMVSDFDFDMPELFHLVPSFDNHSQGPDSERGLYIYDRALEELTQIEKNLTDPEERKTWFAAKRKEKEKLAEHAELCEDWMDFGAWKREQSRAEQREKRKQALKERLGALGYSSKSIDHVSANASFWRNASISPCLQRDVTDRVWAGRKDRVVEVMEKFHKEHMIMRHRVDSISRFNALIDVHTTYMKKYGLSEVNQVIPPPRDIFDIPEVRGIVLAEPLEDPIDSVALFERMPEFGVVWMRSVRQKLVDLMKPHAVVLGLNTVDESSLTLAIAIFKCREDQQMRFPRAILRHCFNYYNCFQQPLQTEDEDMDTSSLSQYRAQVPWYGDNFISFNITAALSAKVVVTAAGLNPGTTTKKAMDTLSPVFTWNKRPTLMKWEELASHPGIVVPDIVLEAPRRGVTVSDLISEDRQPTKRIKKRKQVLDKEVETVDIIHHFMNMEGIAE